MAYETGSVATIGDLEAALKAFLVANGWTLTGSVHHKGDCYVVIGSQTSPAARLTLRGYTGLDGEDSPTGQGPAVVYLGAPTSTTPLTFPLDYHFHAHGDEVYVLINWDDHYWAHLAFGASPVPGLPGTGGWYSGAHAGTLGTRLYYADSSYYYSGVFTPVNGLNSTGLFYGSAATAPSPHYVHHGLDGGGWSATSGGSHATPGAAASAHGIAGPLLLRTPSTWNQQAILLPIQPYIGRASNKVSIVAELAHARYVSLANYSPGDLITLGTDVWKVYPFWRKGSEARPDTSGTDSGFLGLAVRYDGP